MRVCLYRPLQRLISKLVSAKHSNLLCGFSFTCVGGCPHITRAYDSYDSFQPRCIYFTVCIDALLLFCIGLLLLVLHRVTVYGCADLNFDMNLNICFPRQRYAIYVICMFYMYTCLYMYMHICILYEKFICKAIQSTILTAVD